MSLLNIINDIGYISFDETVNAIHQHIGLDKDIEIAEQILLNILEGNIAERPEYKGIELYNSRYGVWGTFEVVQDYSKNKYFRVQAQDRSHYDVFFTINKKQEILADIMRERKQERECMDLPF